jgi:hypothetical protein
MGITDMDITHTTGTAITMVGIMDQRNVQTTIMDIDQQWVLKQVQVLILTEVLLQEQIVRLVE